MGVGAYARGGNCVLCSVMGTELVSLCRSVGSLSLFNDGVYPETQNGSVFVHAWLIYYVMVYMINSYDINIRDILGI